MSKASEWVRHVNTEAPEFRTTANLGTGCGRVAVSTVRFVVASSGHLGIEVIVGTAKTTVLVSPESARDAANWILATFDDAPGAEPPRP